ncbi:hypothetical protein EQU24_16290 [Methylotuvimicrobium buryatense]|uniref:Uncharacterized protein n=1 Tax=Methylotuvimicrobium buryatense TaxID=95641 RepID=A0A4V1IK45_METBY|nr:hypothetical protein EQU24_16290 [Methylotuvimicrobium buryatense]
MGLRCSSTGIPHTLKSAKLLKLGIAGIIDTDMLKLCFGDGAKHYPSAERWSETAVSFLLELSVRDNGLALSVPGY